MSFMAKDHGFRIVGTTINQIRNGTYKSVPSAETLRALAWLAGVSDEVAFTAAGQPVPGPPLGDELPHGADNLSPKSRKVVLDMVRVLIDLETGQAHDEDTNEPRDDLRARRGGRPRQVIGSGQKTDSDALERPSLESLAAHPYFELQSERTDREFEALGEESQDPGGSYEQQD